MTYNWRKGMLTWSWFDFLINERCFLSFCCHNTRFIVGLPEEPS